MNIKMAPEIKAYLRGAFTDPRSGREYTCSDPGKTSLADDPSGAKREFAIGFASPGGKAVSIAAWWDERMAHRYPWSFSVAVGGVEIAPWGTRDTGSIDDRTLRGLVEEAFSFFERLAKDAVKAREDEAKRRRQDALRGL